MAGFVILVVMFLAVTLVFAWTCGENSKTRDKVVCFVVSLCFAALAAPCFFYAGVAYETSDGLPLTDKDLVLNKCYEVVADMGSATNTAVYPKRVLLTKDGNKDPLYFVLLSYLPKDSKYFVPRCYQGETELTLVSCDKPSEEK